MPRPQEELPSRCHRPRSPGALRVRLKPARALGLAPRMDKEWAACLPRLLEAWHELARCKARKRRLLERGLKKHGRNRLRDIFRHWVRSHEQGKRRELEQRMQRQAEARSAAERRALVRRTLRCSFHCSRLVQPDTRRMRRTQWRRWSGRVAGPHRCDASPVGISDAGGKGVRILLPRERRRAASSTQVCGSFPLSLVSSYTIDKPRGGQSMTSRLRSAARRRQSSVSRRCRRCCSTA